ncbi:MAG: transposase domain-containing protein [Bradyrhizobium sp.]|nr:transposase domain-containing protein [Bradyrhizobium sp.]
MHAETHPEARLADVLARLPDYPARRIHELLPWNWQPLKHRLHRPSATGHLPKQPDRSCCRVRMLRAA